METIKTKEIGCAEIVKEVNKEDMVITHYISTRTPDRYDEIMNPKGCDDAEYRKNPVVFFGHRARDLPIAKNIKLSADDYGVIAVTKFDNSDFAKEVFRLNTEGFLNSWSIGFIPLEQPELIEPPPTPSKGGQENSTHKGGQENVKTKGGQKYLYYERWKLLEYSSVPIPANPDAVNLMLKDIRDDKVKEVIEEHNYRMIRMKEVEDMIMQKIREYADTTLERSIEERAGELERSIEERAGELERSIEERAGELERSIERKWNEMMSMPSKAGASEGVTKDELRLFEDRLVRKLQTLINNKTF